MSKILITTEELIMLEAFKKMRQIVKSNAKTKHKCIALNEVFYKANDVLDVAEGDVENGREKNVCKNNYR